MALNRTLGNLATSIDSAANGTFLAKRASGAVFETLDYSDISDYPTGADVDSTAAINLIGSNYLSTRTPGINVTTVITDSGLNHIVPDSAGEVVKIGNYSKGISNVFADSGTTIKISSHTIALSTDHILFDGGTAASDYSGGGDGGSSFSWGGARAVRMGGDANSGKVNQIQYWNMASASDAADFGDLQAAKSEGTGLSNATRGICARGNARTDEIDYITIATLGNATDFGNCLAASQQNAVNGACDGTTGLWAGQDPSSGGYTNVIERITVATPGNATDHGDLTSTRIYVPMTNDASRYLTMGGYGAGGANQINNIEYGTFVAGNSTDFGDLINIGYNGGTASDTTRGIKAGGYVGSNQNVIEYVTIQTPGNGTDFGDLTAGANGNGGHSDGTNAQFAGGWSYAVHIDTMVVQTPGNATDHGDLATGTASSACCAGNAA